MKGPRIVDALPDVGALAGEILRAVKSGKSLSDAMEMQSEIFPAFYVGMVRAGEASGEQWRFAATQEPAVQDEPPGQGLGAQEEPGERLPQAGGPAARRISGKA